MLTIRRHRVVRSARVNWSGIHKPSRHQRNSRSTATEQTSVTVVALPSHSDAERAVMALRRAGVDMTRLSIVGADFHTKEHVGSLSAIGAGLVSLGVPKNSVTSYETAIKASEYVVIATMTRATSSGRAAVRRRRNRSQLRRPRRAAIVSDARHCVRQAS